MAVNGYPRIADLAPDALLVRHEASSRRPDPHAQPEARGPR
jgi:hypothetical protein